MNDTVKQVTDGDDFCSIKRMSIRHLQATEDNLSPVTRSFVELSKAMQSNRELAMRNAADAQTAHEVSMGYRDELRTIKRLNAELEAWRSDMMEERRKTREEIQKMKNFIAACKVKYDMKGAFRKDADKFIGTMAPTA